MKKTKIIVPALAVLLLSTAASVSGTVAWFSMNNSVKVDGMTVTTRVSSNLLIAETNHEENYSDAINQSRTGVLEPASTIDGQNFFYTVNAKGDGDAKTDNYTAYTEDDAFVNAAAGKANVDNDFNNSYGILPANIAANNVVYGYIDYSFFIKATSAANDQVLYMSKCNLTYRNSADTAYEAISNGYAWRVGLLSYETAKETAAADGSLVLRSILAPAQAMNQNQKYTPVANVEAGVTNVDDYFLDQYGKSPASGTATAGITYYEENTADPQAVNSTTTLDDVDEAGSAAQAMTDIDLGETSYTRIVVRLWLEGEDVSCTSTTYAELTRNWKLSLEFKLGNADDGAAQNPVKTGLKAIQSDPALDA